MENESVTVREMLRRASQYLKTPPPGINGPYVTALADLTYSQEKLGLLYRDKNKPPFVHIMNLSTNQLTEYQLGKGGKWKVKS